MPEHFFRHLDGGLYKLVAYARSAETDRDTTVYEHLWPFDRGLWVRDRAEFEARFTPIDAAEVESAMQQDRAQARMAVNAAKAARRAARKL